MNDQYPAPTPDGPAPGGAPAPGPYGQPPSGAPQPGSYGQPPFGAPQSGAPQPGPYGQPPFGAPQSGPYGPPSSGAPYSGSPAYTAAPPYGGQPGYPGGAPQAAGTNGFAIASLIFGIIGGVLFGLIFGFVALSQIRKRGQGGRGLAIAGLTLSGVWLVGLGALVTIGIVGGLEERKPGYSGDISVTSLRTGDCVNALRESPDLRDIPKTPCAGPHEGEVFANYDLPAGAWPGDAAVAKQAEAGCNIRFAGYSDSDDPSIELFYLHPLKESWSLDRGVTCIATKGGAPMTGSLRK